VTTLCVTLDRDRPLLRHWQRLLFKFFHI